MIALLVASALAASPGGVRLGPGVPASFVSARHVFVEDARNDFHIHQTTLRGQWNPHPWGLDLAVPVVVGWGGGWRDLGLGQIRLGARRWMGGRAAPVSIGIELGLPVPYAAGVQVWASVASETLIGMEMLVVGEGALFPQRPLTWRVASGFRQGPYMGVLYGVLPLLDASVAHVEPITGPLSAGLEAEVLLGDYTPATLRPFLRVDLGGWSIDLLAQVPIVQAAEGRLTPQGGLQVRYFPPLATAAQ